MTGGAAGESGQYVKEGKYNTFPFRYMIKDCRLRSGDVGRILRTFKIKKNVEVTNSGKIII